MFTFEKSIVKQYHGSLTLPLFRASDAVSVLMTCHSWDIKPVFIRALSRPPN